MVEAALHGNELGRGGGGKGQSPSARPSSTARRPSRPPSRGKRSADQQIRKEDPSQSQGSQSQEEDDEHWINSIDEHHGYNSTLTYPDGETEEEMMARAMAASLQDVGGQGNGTSTDGSTAASPPPASSRGAPPPFSAGADAPATSISTSTPPRQARPQQVQSPLPLSPVRHPTPPDGDRGDQGVQGVQGVHGNQGDRDATAVDRRLQRGWEANLKAAGNSDGASTVVTSLRPAFNVHSPAPVRGDREAAGSDCGSIVGADRSRGFSMLAGDGGGLGAGESVSTRASTGQGSTADAWICATCVSSNSGGVAACTACTMARPARQTSAQALSSWGGSFAPVGLGAVPTGAPPSSPGYLAEQADVGAFEDCMRMTSTGDAADGNEGATDAVLDSFGTSVDAQLAQIAGAALVQFDKRREDANAEIPFDGDGDCDGGGGGGGGAAAPIDAVANETEGAHVAATNNVAISSIPTKSQLRAYLQQECVPKDEIERMIACVPSSRQSTYFHQQLKNSSPQPTGGLMRKKGEPVVFTKGGTLWGELDGAGAGAGHADRPPAKQSHAADPAGIGPTTGTAKPGSTFAFDLDGPGAFDGSGAGGIPSTGGGDHLSTGTENLEGSLEGLNREPSTGFESPAPWPSSQPLLPSADKIAQVAAMGFDEASAAEALSKFSNSVALAVEHLLGWSSGE